MTPLRNSRILYLGVIVFLCLSGIPGETRAQAMVGPKRLQVIGTSEIRGGNVAGARDEAIEHGLWNAVEKGVELIISPAAVVSHFQPLSAQIYSQPEAYVQNYKVLTESKVGRSYRVVVDATVLVAALREKLEYMGILATGKDLPKVVLLFSERNVSQRQPRHTWEHQNFSDRLLTAEAALNRALEERGFMVLKADLAPNGETAEERFAGTGPTKEILLQWAEHIGADVAILGNAMAKRTGNVSGTGIQSVEARLSLQVFQVDNREVIGTFETSNAAAHRDESIAGTKALGLATSDITTELIRQVTASWRGETRQTTLVKLFVKGIEEYADFIQLRKAIKNEITGVKNVYLRAIRSDEAQLDVELQGTARILAEELVLKSFDGFGINVFEVGKDTIRLDLIRKEEFPEDVQQPMETDPQAW